MSSSTPGTPGATPATVHVLRHRGATYELRLVCCNKPNCTKCNVDGRMHPSHGPYWYLCYTSHRKTCRAYLGKHLDTRKFRNADGVLDLNLVRTDRHKKSPIPVAHVGGPGQTDMLEDPPVPDSKSERSLREQFRDWLHGPKHPPKDV